MQSGRFLIGRGLLRVTGVALCNTRLSVNFRYAPFATEVFVAVLYVAQGQFRKSLLYSITSSARASTAEGMMRSSDLAILRFKLNSNAVGRSIGISPGATPRNI
jgi:hypothetical protein